MADEGLMTAIYWVGKVEEEYPQLVFLLNIPGVRENLLKLVAGEITDQVFATELYKSDWWKNSADTDRAYQVRKQIDPQSVEQDIKQRKLRIQQLVDELGIGLNYNEYANQQAIQKWGYDLGKVRSQMEGYGIDFDAEGGSHAIAEMSLRFDWNEEQILDFLTGFVSYDQEGAQANAGIGAAMTEMKSVAKDLMIDVSNEAAFNDARKVLMQGGSVEAVRQDYRKRALARYGDNETLRRVIDEGGSLYAYFDPYRQAVAQEMEIVPEDVDFLHDDRWSPVMNHAGEDGTLRPMTLTETVQHVRGRNEWGDTRKGQGEVAELGNSLIRKFGARA